DFHVTGVQTCALPISPGQPMAISGSPSSMMTAGLGVSRGRFPGARAAGWSASTRDWQPRPDTPKPRPGIIGVQNVGSLGVAENKIGRTARREEGEVQV